MPTVAEQIGQTPHLSPLLRRLRRAGLTNADVMRRTAVARGCWHYRRPDDDCTATTLPARSLVSDLDLAMGMLTAAQEFDPVGLRCAAQLLSSRDIPEDAMARLAIQERAVAVLRHIARAGAELDVEEREKWIRLLTKLPPTHEVPEGRLPHRTRFVLETGLSWHNRRLQWSGRKVWLRPHPAPSS